MDMTPTPKRSATSSNHRGMSQTLKGNPRHGGSKRSNMPVLCLFSRRRRHRHGGSRRTSTTSTQQAAKTATQKKAAAASRSAGGRHTAAKGFCPPH